MRVLTIPLALEKLRGRHGRVSVRVCPPATAAPIATQSSCFGLAPSIYFVIADSIDRNGGDAFGRSRQGAPDRKTQKIPLRTRRSFTRGTPRGFGQKRTSISRQPR
jgi:hypothetical protein